MTRLHGAFLRAIYVALFLLVGVGLFAESAAAANLFRYSDTLSDSEPSGFSNHTFEFTIRSDIAAGGYVEVDFPADFTVLAPTSTWGTRNVELYVDGVARTASGTLSAAVDQVVINDGPGGSIRYNLNPTAGIPTDSTLELRVGNHTSNSILPFSNVSTSTVGTTTVSATSTFAGDIEPIQNSPSIGTKKISLDIGGDTEEISGEFHIAMIQKVGLFGDTTETVPPFRFNGAPTSSVGGTTLNVEISLETDELAICRWTTASNTPYFSIPNVMDVTGTIIHSQVVAVVPSSFNAFYIRCLDDEDNFNTDDYVIAFAVNDAPTGSANEEGAEQGDGTGTGDSGAGGGTGGGGTSSGSSGQGNTGGSSSGSGGSGGGSGGSSGDDDEGETGGGLGSDGPFPSGDAEIRVSGYAFPDSEVVLIVDGVIAETTRAGADGEFDLAVEDIAQGVYTFGIYAIDEDDVHSSTFSTSFTVVGGNVSELSNVNIMPSILITPDPVDPGQQLTISGYALANANVTIENEREGVSQSLQTFNTTSDGDGAWAITVDTSRFTTGTYKARAQSEQTEGLGISTNFSDYTFYGVGQQADVPLNADLNRDGSVNLTDFSILLFWWGGNGGDSDPPADINQDGSVSLTDFSIMLFQWTG